MSGRAGGGGGAGPTRPPTHRPRDNNGSRSRGALPTATPACVCARPPLAARPAPARVRAPQFFKDADGSFAGNIRLFDPAVLGSKVRECVVREARRGGALSAREVWRAAAGLGLQRARTRDTPPRHPAAASSAHSLRVRRVTARWPLWAPARGRRCARARARAATA